MDVPDTYSGEATELGFQSSARPEEFNRESHQTAAAPSKKGGNQVSPNKKQNLNTASHPSRLAASNTTKATLAELATQTNLSESQRQTFYERDLLGLFRSRILLVGALGIGFLPIFTAFYFRVAPSSSHSILGINSLMAVVLLLCALASRAAKSVQAQPIIALIGFCLFCAGHATLIHIVNHDIVRHGNNSQGVLLVILGSFIHLLLAILILPFSLSEAIIAVLVIFVALTWGVRQGLLSTQSSVFEAQMFVLGTASLLLLTLSQLNAQLRRRAFNAAFDAALLAARMREMSETDPLTGGYNRRGIESYLAHELTRAARFNHCLSVIMFDLDNFKPVNDTLGHPVGDKVLCEIWQAANRSLREVDMLARLGGDEFLIVLPETGTEAARGAACRLRLTIIASLTSAFGADTLPGSVTISMGVLTLDGKPQKPMAQVLKQVDDVLYEAKRSGKNRVAVG